MLISKNSFARGYFPKTSQNQNLPIYKGMTLQEVFKKTLTQTALRPSQDSYNNFLKADSNADQASLPTTLLPASDNNPQNLPLSSSQPLTSFEETTTTRKKESFSFETHKVKTNEGGGNCLFYSIIDALTLDLTHTELRQMLYTYVKENAKNDSQLQTYLIADAKEIAGDLHSQCEEALKNIKNKAICSDLLLLLNISKTFSLFPLLKSFPDFFKPFTENQTLINTIKETLENKHLPREEKTSLILRHTEEIKILLTRLQKRWEKIAFMDFSEKSSPKIRQDMIECMIEDMQKIGSFGGQAALHALTSLLNCSIHVCSKNHGKQTFHTIRSFGTAEPKVFVLLNNNHYEALFEKKLLQNNHLPATSAIEKTILSLSEKNLDELSSSILAGLKISAVEAIKLLNEAKNLDPQKAENGKKLATIKTLTDILGL